MRIKLQRLRENAGYTQATMAEAIGISRSHYSQIETGAKAPALKTGLRIKQVLSYEGDDIFLDENDPFRVAVEIERPQNGA